MQPTNSISFVGSMKGKQFENDKDYSFFEKSIKFKKCLFSYYPFQNKKFCLKYSETHKK